MRGSDLVRESRSALYESLRYLLLHAGKVVFDLCPFTDFQGIIAIGEDDRLQIAFRMIRHQVAVTGTVQVDMFLLQTTESDF